MMEIDCGRCGSDEMRFEDGIYTCKHCGKTYIAEEAENRKRALGQFAQKKKLQILFMIGCMIFLVLDVILLPGYANSGANTTLLYVSTAICAGLFAAALAVRILLGKDRRKIYPGK